MVCAVNGCDRSEKITRGWCGMHYKRWRKTGNPLGKLQGVPSRANVGCKIEGCENPHNARGWCLTHYNRWKQKNDPMKLIQKGWHVDSNGYIRVMDPDFPTKTIGQHRLIMSQQLGRRLERHENVHHKNGVRNDNRLENLELWSKMQPCGQRLEDKIQYAIEILNLYAPHLLK